MNSENVYSAFFTLMQAVPGFVTFERKWQLIEEVDPNLMPYMGIKERERSVFARSFDGIEAWMLTLDIIIYVNQPDQNQPTSPIFNPLIDAVVNALTPIAIKPVTLAGVEYTPSLEMNQKIMFFEGWLQSKSAIHIPVQIIAPDDA